LKAYKIIITLSLILCSCAHKPPIVQKNITINGGELVSKVITEDTTLSGEITVSGSLIVKKSANLTILPGTVIEFKRVYVDKDDISDSDIVIEGSITAIGTPENPITFTSAEDEPAPKDWKFLFINFARKSTLKYCIVEYAFSGIQVHFTNATVEDCEFRNNFDGVRFSTAKITVKNNNIHDNINGIRYEERGARADVTHNFIHHNKVGIFPVIRSDDLSKIENNNIVDNSDYSVKLGMEQTGDITMQNNFWGTTDADSIKGGIFDKAFDEQLGGVMVEPFLLEKVNILP